MIDALLLGNGAMAPRPDRPLSSLLLRVGGRMILCDCGEGTQVQMRRLGTGFKALSAIFLTHMHADHTAGLPGLFLTIANAGRTDLVDIYGPPGTMDVVQGLRTIAPVLPYPMAVHEIESGAEVFLQNGIRVRAARAEHRVQCLAYRFDRGRNRGFRPEAARALGLPVTLWSTLQHGQTVELNGHIVAPDDVLGPPRRGVSVGLATDTRPTPEITGLMRGVDLLVAEATYARDDDLPHARQWGHMTLREACDLASAVDATHLWLTHFGGTIENPLALQEAAATLFPAAAIGYPGIRRTIAFTDDIHD